MALLVVYFLFCFVFARVVNHVNKKWWPAKASADSCSPFSVEIRVKKELAKPCRELENLFWNFVERCFLLQRSETVSWISVASHSALSHTFLPTPTTQPCLQTAQITPTGLLWRVQVSVPPRQPSMFAGEEWEERGKNREVPDWIWVDNDGKDLIVKNLKYNFWGYDRVCFFLRL